VISFFESVAPILLLAIAVGMDAFSVSLSVGLMRIRLRFIFLYLFFIGLFHVIMPFLGMLVGHFLSLQLGLLAQMISGWMLIMIGGQMIISTFIKKDSLRRIHLFGLLTLAFTVSLDSFSVGISLGLTMFSIDQIAIIFLFGLVSLFLATFGFVLARKGKSFFGIYSEMVGGIILLAIGIQMIL